MAEAHDPLAELRAQMLAQAMQLQEAERQVQQTSERVGEIIQRARDFRRTEVGIRRALRSLNRRHNRLQRKVMGL